MTLGSPYQGQRIASLVEERLRELERQAEEAGAPVYGPDLGEVLSETEENVARNDQEWGRRKAERDRLQLEGQVAFNQREEEDRNQELNKRLNEQFPMPY